MNSATSLGSLSLMPACRAGTGPLPVQADTVQALRTEMMEVGLALGSGVPLHR